MKKRSRRRIKSRFYVFVAILTSLILCLIIVKTMNSLIKPPDIPAAGQIADVSDVSPDEQLVICLDPGHGGYDSGTISSDGIKEKDINLKVAQKLGRILEKSDIKIVHTRTTDEMKGATQKEDLKIRCDFANSGNADIYISIHCNFDEISTKTRGAELWCRFPNNKSEELAINLQKQLAELGYTSDRGIKYEADGELYILKNTRADAVLVELGFLSNNADCSFLQSEKGQEECAEAIAQGVLDYAQENYIQFANK